MSVSLLLLPFALAAVGAMGGTAAVGSIIASQGAADEPGGGGGLVVRTRMKDTGLLGAALESIGARSVSLSDSRVSAEIDGLQLTMERNADGVWQANLSHADGHQVDERAAVELLQRLDTAYAALVQQTVAERIRQRASSTGFELVSETVDENSAVTMVLAVRQNV